ILRCNNKAKVIRFQVHAAVTGLIHQNNQAQRPRPRIQQTPKQELLRNAGIYDSIHHENIASPKLRRLREKDLAPVEPGLFHVTNVRANKMANHGPGNAPEQIRRENKRTLKDNDGVHRTPREITRDGTAQFRNSAGQARCRIYHLELRLQNSSSAITTPALVPEPTANSSATRDSNNIRFSLRTRRRR